MAFWNLFDGKKIRKLKEAVQSRPDDASAHFELAVGYEQQGRVEEAISEFRETLRIRPDSAEAHFNLAVLYEERNEGGKAISHILEAGNWFKRRNDTHNKDRAREKLREYYQKFGIKREDLEVQEQ